MSADDFGLDVEINEAVENAHRDGVLGSASLMVGETATDDAVLRARRLPSLRVGLHVVLADGTPVSDPVLIPDLVDRCGRFPASMVARSFGFFFRPSVRRQLAREIRAQFAAFAATGLALDHANAHKHFHLHPTVAGLILRIGREFGLKSVRLPREPKLTVNGEQLGGGLGAAALRLWTGHLRRRLARAGITTNDHVFGLSWSGHMTEARLLALVPHLPAGVSEIYFHPSRRRTPDLCRAMPDYDHLGELQALLSPRLRQTLDASGIVTTDFTRLAELAA